MVSDLLASASGLIVGIVVAILDKQQWWPWKSG